MKKILSMIILIILPLICLAEQYTMEELVNIGLENSYDIQKEIVSKKNSTSLLRSSIYSILPTVTAGVEKVKYYDQIYEPNETDWNNSGYLTLSKSFFLNEPSYYNIRTSIYGMKNAQRALDETRKQIAYYVFASYLDVLELQETLEIQQKNLELQNKIQQQIKVQYETGNKSLLELKQSEVSLIDYEIAVNEATNSLSKTRKDLFSYLNINDDGFEFVVPDFKINLEKLEFQSNNLLEQKLNTLKINKLLHLQTTMNFLPTISIGYSFDHLDQDDVTAFSEYTRNSQYLSLSASWNIFGLMDNYEKTIRSKRNLKIQKLDYEKSERDYGIQLNNLQNDVETLKRSFDLYDEKLHLAEENLNMAQEHFRLGMISLLDMDRSKIDFQNTQLARIQNHYQLMKKQEEINLLLSSKILGKW
ncbi:MAG: TolC family protein [Candidatus Cloacimonetes bacterium]|jgi:outer membrane protein|nr:TolC family protein [Candidatus Cloacimonadota bacterium]